MVANIKLKSLSPIKSALETLSSVGFCSTAENPKKLAIFKELNIKLFIEGAVLCCGVGTAPTVYNSVSSIPVNKTFLLSYGSTFPEQKSILVVACAP